MLRPFILKDKKIVGISKNTQFLVYLCPYCAKRQHQECLHFGMLKTLSDINIIGRKLI